MLNLIGNALELINKLVRPKGEKVKEQIINWLPQAIRRQSERKTEYEKIDKRNSD